MTGPRRASSDTVIDCVNSTATESSFDPSTGECTENIPVSGQGEVDRLVAAALSAQPSTGVARSRWLEALARALLNRSDALVAIADQETALGTERPTGELSGAGRDLVRHPGISAVAFTGSQTGGMSLWRLANERSTVVPVFAEMGTVNPVLITAAGAAAFVDHADGLVESFTMGTGQFCTKPGVAFAPAGSRVVDEVAAALIGRDPKGWMLTEPIAQGFRAGVAARLAAGAQLVASVPGPGVGWSADATVLAVPAELVTAGSLFLEECFGPLLVVCEYADKAELSRLLTTLPGGLAGSVLSGGNGDCEVRGLVQRLAEIVGRVIVDGFPTGVAVSWAQHHGGPWPASNAAAHTSVGASATRRFLRPVAYQNVPVPALPTMLRNSTVPVFRVNGSLHTSGGSIGSGERT